MDQMPYVKGLKLIEGSDLIRQPDSEMADYKTAEVLLPLLFLVSCALLASLDIFVFRWCISKVPPVTYL